MTDKEEAPDIGVFLCSRNSTLMPAALAFAIFLGVVLSLVLFGATDASVVHGQEPDDPFETPSAAGEIYLLIQAGLLREPERTPGAPSAVPTGRLGADVLVNNPADDTDPNTTQSETTLAVRGNTICAGYNNSGPPLGLSGLSRSTDLGATWTDLGGLGIGESGDAALAVHQGTGTFYYAEIATIGGNPAIGVARSADDCQTFGPPVDASPDASGLPDTFLNDKPWIAADNTGGATDGRVYVCWTRFIDEDLDGIFDDSELRFSRSLDGGLSYQSEQVLATSTAPFGCSVDVGPRGQVYVAWADRAGPPETINDIRFRRSTDGVNFDPTVTVGPDNRHPGTDRIRNCPPTSTSTRPTLNGDIRMLHQAWQAVDTTGGPYDGNIYVVWASDPGPGDLIDNSDVYFSRSTDGGATWGAKVQLGTSGGQTDQFEPFVEVGGAGTVSVAWYDRRNDQADNMLIDVYTTFSFDGGASFEPIVRVTDASFPVPPINPNFDFLSDCYMGEYIAVAADADNFYYAWGDNSRTVAGRPDPDVAFDFQDAGILESKVTASDGALGDLFGSTVSISGDTMVAGAPFHNGVGIDSGSAYVFVVDQTGWSQQQKLTASDAAGGDSFGASVAIDGNTVVVGAPNDDGNGPDSGSAYVFVRSGTTWSQQQKIIGSDLATSTAFGGSVAISGDTVVVGAVRAEAAYVFVRSASTWTEQAKLTPSDGVAGDRFGNSVAIHEDIALVGAPAHATSTGAAYPFLRSGTSWRETQKLTASDGAALDLFGFSVAINRRTVVVGAPFHDDVAANSGSAYVFEATGSTTWAEQAKLTASDAAMDAEFGDSVSIVEDAAVVGARGDDDAGFFSGSAYIFERSGTTWTQQRKITAGDAAAGDAFGDSIAFSGDTAVVGASHDDDNGGNSGSAYIYDLNIRKADLSVTKSDSPDPVVLGDNLTYTLAVHNDGADIATGVAVRDALWPTVNFVSATSSQGSCSESAGVVECLLGDLTVGADATITIVVTPTVAGTIINRAEVVSNEPDPDAGDRVVQIETTAQNPP